MTAVFHNSREHADVVEFWIDGIRYKGPVIIDDGGAQDRKKPSTDHVDGLILVDLVMYVPLSLLKTIPQKDLNVEIGDCLYRITKAVSYAQLTAGKRRKARRAKPRFPCGPAGPLRP